MAVDFSKEVEYLSRLARLYLTPEEKERMAGQLSEILKTAQLVQNLDTSGIEPTSHVVSLKVAFREDQVSSSLPLSCALQNAPRRENSYFRVPQIAALEQGEEE